MDRRAINPDASFDPSDRRYSHAWTAGGTLYMSGQTGWRPDMTLAVDDVGAQTRQAFENVGTILEAVDRALEDVVKVTSYFVDVDRDLAGYKDVWAEVFSEPWPAHTAIGVDALAHPDLLVEVEAEVPLDG